MPLVYLIKKHKGHVNSPIFVALVFLIVAALTPVLARAQDQQGGSGLSISPTRTELTVLPGSTDTVTVSLKNITSGPIVAKVFINDFEPDNETGEPRLIVDPNERSAASIASFVRGIEDITLEEGESRDFDVQIVVPENAAPGGYYGALRFQALPVGSEGGDGDGNEVSLTANLLSLVLIEVQGDIEERVSINSVSAFLDDNAGSIFTRKPNFVGVEVENLGNSFVKPFGRVSVKNMQGDEIFSYELNDSNPRSNVLPDSRRTFKDRLINVTTSTVNGDEVTEESSPITSPGRYTISADISYGNGGQVFTVTSTFWYIPIWLVIIIVVVLLTLVVGAFYLYRKYSTRSTKRKK